MLDLKIANAEEGIPTSDSDITIFAELHTQVKNLQYKIDDCYEKVKLVNDAILKNMLENPEKEEEIREIFEPRMEYFQNKAVEKVSSFFAILKKKIGFKILITNAIVSCFTRRKNCQS